MEAGSNQRKVTRNCPELTSQSEQELSCIREYKEMERNLRTTETLFSEQPQCLSVKFPTSGGLLMILPKQIRIVAPKTTDHRSRNNNNDNSVWNLLIIIKTRNINIGITNCQRKGPETLVQSSVITNLWSIEKGSCKAQCAVKWGVLYCFRPQIWDLSSPLILYPSVLSINVLPCQWD